MFLKDPSHRDSEVNFVFEDMQVMSDFELSRLCLQERVSLERSVLVLVETITDGGCVKGYATK